MSQANASTVESVAVASLREKGVVLLALGSDVVVGRHSTTGQAGVSALRLKSSQVVRDVAFLQIPQGPLCAVTAGDGKFIHVFNIASSPELNPHAPPPVDSSEAEETTASAQPTVEISPDATFGPHTKRITGVVTTGSNIIFSDKFGDVHEITATWDAETKKIDFVEVDGNARFLLQHFSAISYMYVSRIVPEALTTHQWLITCDSDKHTRISNYPEVHRIEQFMWATSPQSTVTSIIELNGLRDAKARFFATGDHAGRVFFWVANRSALTGCTPRGGIEGGNPQFVVHEPIKIISSYIGSEAKARRCQVAQAASASFSTDPSQIHNPDHDYGTHCVEDLGAVVALSYLEVTHSEGCKRAEMDVTHGVLIAYEKSQEVTFLPIAHAGESGARVLPACSTRTSLSAPPVAMVSISSSSVVVLQRNGAADVLELSDEYEAGDSENNRKWSIGYADIQFDVLQKEIARMIGEPSLNASPLHNVDLFSSWTTEVQDPRLRSGAKRKNNGNSSGDDDDNDDEGDNDKETPRGDAENREAAADTQKKAGVKAAKTDSKA